MKYILLIFVFLILFYENKIVENNDNDNDNDNEVTTNEDNPDSIIERCVARTHTLPNSVKQIIQIVKIM